MPSLNLSLTAGTNGALDGNLVANQVSRSFAFTSLNLALGDRFFLRWQDVNNSGNDAGIAIDDMTLTFVVSVVPEVSGAALGALAAAVAGLACAGGKARRRQS